MKRLPIDKWIDSLLQPGTTVTADVYGFPFRFSPPREWDTDERRLDENLIYFVSTGRCEAMLNVRSFPLQTGDMCWICPGVKFRFRATDSHPLEIFRFRLTAMRGDSILRPDWDFHIAAIGGAVMDRVRALLPDPLAQSHPSPRKTACLAAVFAMDIMEASQPRATPLGLPSSACQRISRYVRDHIHERIQPADLARAAGYSPDYFSRIFRQSFGMPPRQWLLEQRLQLAAGMLLEPGLRITEIAESLGYPDVFLFSRQFRKQMGMSPRAWQKGKLCAGPRLGPSKLPRRTPNQIESYQPGQF